MAESQSPSATCALVREEWVGRCRRPLAAPERRIRRGAGDSGQVATVPWGSAACTLSNLERAGRPAAQSDLLGLAHSSKHDFTCQAGRQVAGLAASELAQHIGGLIFSFCRPPRPSPIPDAKHPQPVFACTFFPTRKDDVSIPRHHPPERTTNPPR